MRYDENCNQKTLAMVSCSTARQQSQDTTCYHDMQLNVKFEENDVATGLPRSLAAATRQQSCRSGSQPPLAHRSGSAPDGLQALHMKEKDAIHK